MIEYMYVAETCGRDECILELRPRTLIQQRVSRAGRLVLLRSPEINRKTCPRRLLRPHVLGPKVRYEREGDWIDLSPSVYTPSRQLRHLLLQLRELHLRACCSDA